MSKRRISAAVAALGFAAIGIISAGQQSATADAAPQAKDVVGVGSDIIQNAADFLADGAPNGDPGYNTAGNRFRVFSFDSSADANGRNAFTDPALGNPTVLNPSAVLRAGTSPVQRPNGGGAGITALVGDGSAGVSANLIQFVRSPNLPSAANQTAASANLGTELHTIQFADDKQYIATSTTTHAPTAGLTPQQLAGIYCSNASTRYTTWNEVGGTGTNAIVPQRPQDSAGVLKQFLAVLNGALGGATCSWNSNVVAVQQNDPTTITSSPNKDDVIVPFPEGRYKLLSSGYFRDPNTAYSIKPGGGLTPGTLSASGIALQVPGTNGVAAGSYVADLPYYILFRDSDAHSATPWQPGSKLNWVETLFYNEDYNYADPADSPNVPAPWVASAAAKQLILNLGLTPVYVDKGTTHS